MRIRSSLSARTPSLLSGLLSCLVAITACDKGKASTTPEDAAAAGQGQAAAGTPTVDAAKAGGLVQVANADLGKGRYNAAKKRAREALDANPENADAWGVLGAASWRAGDLSAALEAFKKAVEINPKMFGAVIGYAQALQATGQHQEAIAVLDKLMATESEGFESVPCQDNSCDVGFCDKGTCRPSMQVAPRFVKLLSQYLLLDVDAAIKTTDDIFVGVGAQDYETGFARAYASLLRPLAGKGKMVEIVGTQGTAPLGIDYQFGARYTEVSAGGKKKLAIISDVTTEALIDPTTASAMGLKELGKVTPYGTEQALSLVLVPEIKIGDLTIKNIPAFIQDLSAYGQTIGSVPGFVLGQQVLSKLGALRYDFPKNELVVMAETPQAPAGAATVPFIMLNMLNARIPAVQVQLDESGKTFWSMLGGSYQSALALSKKEYLRAGHRPEDVADPELPEQGLKVVLVDKVSLGDLTERGVGGFVFLNTPPDANLKNIVVTTGFNLDGYVNQALMARWALTTSYRDGKLYIESPSTQSAEAGPEKKTR